MRYGGSKLKQQQKEKEKNAISCRSLSRSLSLFLSGVAASERRGIMLDVGCRLRGGPSL